MKLTKIVIAALAFVSLFSACRKEEVAPAPVTDTTKKVVIDTTKPVSVDTTKPKLDTTRVYIVNYGSYSTVKGEISTFNVLNNTVTNNAIKTANGVTFSSNIQSIATFNGVLYCMSNSGDKIDILNAKTLKAAASPISQNITKPRFFVANGSLGYVSCFGEPGDANWTTMPNSYIAVIDLKTNAFLHKIAIPNATEGMIIAEGKLFVALEYINKIAVVDLATENISYIDVPALGQQFVQDKNGMLWVSMVSEYTVSFDSTKRGVAIIDPKTNTFKSLVNIQGIGSDGYLAINKAKDKIFVLTKQAWPGTKTEVYTVSVDSKIASTSPVVSGEGINNIGYDILKSKLYVLIGAGSSANGKLQIYNDSGVKEVEVETGIAPQQVYFEYGNQVQ